MSGVEEGRTDGKVERRLGVEGRKPANEEYGKCPVEAQFSAEAVGRVLANEYLCADEYGEGVGDPQTGWWSVNWVNTPAMAPGPFEEEPDQESALPPSK